MITLLEWIDQFDKALKDKPKFHRFTLWEDAKQVIDVLGLVCDKDSRADLYEWYLTLDDASDAEALTAFLKTDVRKPTFKVSIWNNDPRA